MERQKWNYSGTTSCEPSRREIEHGELSKKIACEGMVLLKNEGVLPLKKTDNIALLGSGAEMTVKGGRGSGDVNNRKNVSIYEGLEEAGMCITSEDWIADFKERHLAAREQWKELVLAAAVHEENPFDAYASNPFMIPQGRAVADYDLNEASVAVYVISRSAGEGKDRCKETGDYYLSREEEQDLYFLNQKNIPIVLIMNVGSVVELTDVLEKLENVKAVLNISQPGQEGGRAVADILLGNQSPSGRLTATWARRFEDYPCSDTFGYLNGNLDEEKYSEGIFVGYRYFDTKHVKTLFPFGHGLSYTNFQTTMKSFRRLENGYQVQAQVKNIGNQYSGKEVVQIYLEFPMEEENRELHRLVGFAKTKCLQPGESQMLSIDINMIEFASYSVFQHGWVVEAGKYQLCFGKNIEELYSFAEVLISQNDLIEPEENHLKKRNEKEWTDQYTVEELMPLLYGNISQSKSTLGAAGIRVPGSAGETTDTLYDWHGVRYLVMADGPAGLRLQQDYEVDQITGKLYGKSVLGSLEGGILETAKHREHADVYYQYCTAFPVGTALAQTWNLPLAEEFGKAIAVEMEEFHIDLWLAPGMNIQRNPLCGRNFEYYSEDPYVSGNMAAAVTLGVQSNPKCGVTIKHFACNNQEDHRMGVDVRISERAFREIYLRGFEIAIKKARPAAVMSSYNRINGIYAANNEMLCTKILRDEWGYEGVVMTDWNTTMPEDGSLPWKCAQSGNDLIMPGSQKDADSIRFAYEKGLLSEEKIRTSAGHVLKLIEKLSNGSK